MKIRVRAAGHLKLRMPGQQTNLELDLDTPARVQDVLDRLDLARSQVWIMRVNGQTCQAEQGLTDDDYVELFPLVGGG